MYTLDRSAGPWDSGAGGTIQDDDNVEKFEFTAWAYTDQSE